MLSKAWTAITAFVRAFWKLILLVVLCIIALGGCVSGFASGSFANAVGMNNAQAAFTKTSGQAEPTATPTGIITGTVKVPLANLRQAPSACGEKTGTAAKDSSINMIGRAKVGDNWWIHAYDKDPQQSFWIAAVLLQNMTPTALEALPIIEIDKTAICPADDTDLGSGDE